jgi:hypothetical protein
MDGGLAVRPDCLCLYLVRNIWRGSEALERKRVPVERERERLADARIVEGGELPVGCDIPIVKHWRLLYSDIFHRAPPQAVLLA